jgi:hypothetical protein
MKYITAFVCKDKQKETKGKFLIQQNSQDFLTNEGTMQRMG